MTNCPHCGAKEIKYAPYDTFYGDRPRFVCNTTFRGIAGYYCLANQLEQAKAEIASLKRRIEEAEPLVWGLFGEVHSAESISGVYSVSYWKKRRGWRVSLNATHVNTSSFGTPEIAKSHAESLHQQEWAKMMEKWGRKG